MGRYYEGGTIPWVKSGELREGVITGTEERVTQTALIETSIKLVPAGSMQDYNECRPHESLGNVPPTAFRARVFNQDVSRFNLST